MASKTKSKELTGRHVLFILLAFFGVMFAVNTYFTVMAVQSFRGEDVKRSYRQGLDYNTTLEARAAQATLGWSAHVNMRSNPDGTSVLIVRVDDSVGVTPPSLTLSGHLRHPTDTDNDIELAFKSDGDGLYRANLGTLTGRYQLKATANNGQSEFKFTHNLNVS